eukprot:Em0002g1881a
MTLKGTVQGKRPFFSPPCEGAVGGGGPSRVEDQDPLIQQLHQLQQRLASVAGIWELNGEFLKPFCDVVLSDDTSGPVTGMAISSVEKFLTYGMLDPTHPNSAAIIEAVSDAITHARFVGTNQTSDEVVLMKIVEVLHTILGAPVARLLSNESVCELMQSCFRICFEMRLSEEAWGGGDDVCSVDQTLHCEEGSGEEQNHVTTEGDDENKGTAPEAPPTEEGEEETKQTGEEELDPPPLDAPPTSSLSCVPESIEVLLRTVYPVHNSEALVAIGLNLVCAALKCSGPVVCQYQSLLLLIQDGLCRNLCTMFLNILIDLISSENLKCPMDRRELALECVLQVPSSLTPVHLMSLEALYAVMTTIQSGHTPTPFSEAQPTSQSLPPYQDDHAPIVHTSSPSLYKGEGPDGHVVVEVMLVATELFNKKASSAVEHMVKQGVFTSPPDPKEVTSFFHDNQELHKAMIGDYIGDRRNIDILNAYVGRFTVSGVDLVESLRHFLEAFRLPSESPIISRILETFTEHWLKCNEAGLGKVFANKDAVFVLAYSIIMLNVVLHSTEVKESMTLQEYIHNQRKTNGGTDFPPEFLTEVYNAIKKEEIIMPEEHTGAVKENYRWKTLLTRSQWPEAQYWEVATSEYDQDLFLMAWGPTVAAVSYVFDIAEDKNIVQKAIGGFSKCASIAAHYEVTEVFDNLVISLCKFTTLLTTPEPPSSMAFTIGINHKVRLSILTLFSLAHRHGNILREGKADALDLTAVANDFKEADEQCLSYQLFISNTSCHTTSLYEIRFWCLTLAPCRRYKAQYPEGFKIQIVDFYLFRYGDTAMQSKSTFPARIAPFSVLEPLPFSRVGLRKVRFERERGLYFALLYLHNGSGSCLDFEPLGVLCLVTSARSKANAPAPTPSSTITSMQEVSHVEQPHALNQDGACC